jgi:coatomer subunit beta'
VCRYSPGHAHNVSAVCFHPELPVIITGSEDGTLRIWHSTTYRLENTLNYGLERVWAIGVIKGSNAVSIGYDEVGQAYKWLALLYDAVYIAFAP